MADFFLGKGEEKKVEYIELIYDLIFVYIIGRNNSLLHHVEDGFISSETFLTYIISTLVILQIWFFTTIFINRYGTNGRAEYIGIFINMYLLYYIAQGTRSYWQDYFVSYNLALGLILINLGVQYFLKLCSSEGMMPWEDAHIRHNMRFHFIQAVLVFLTIPVYLRAGVSVVWVPLVFGIVTMFVTRDTNRLVMADFGHLTERIMLYVVFSFGEMIIGIAGYFEGGLNPGTIYYSLMAFAIVAGLFLSYGFMYDHLLDREKKTAGSGYMLLHIFLITALNNITVALEFMQESEVAQTPKNIFLAVSFLAYFFFLFLMEHYAKEQYRVKTHSFWILLLILAAFAVLIFFTYRSPQISIAVTVVFIYVMLGVLVTFWRKQRRA